MGKMKTKKTMKDKKTEDKKETWHCWACEKTFSRRWLLTRHSLTLSHSIRAANTSNYEIDWTAEKNQTVESMTFDEMKTTHPDKVWYAYIDTNEDQAIDPVQIYLPAIDVTDDPRKYHQNYQAQAPQESEESTPDFISMLCDESISEDQIQQELQRLTSVLPPPEKTSSEEVQETITTQQKTIEEPKLSEDIKKKLDLQERKKKIMASYPDTGRSSIALKKKIKVVARKPAEYVTEANNIEDLTAEFAELKTSTDIEQQKTTKSTVNFTPESMEQEFMQLMSHMYKQEGQWLIVDECGTTEEDILLSIEEPEN